ncbi:Lipid A export ATP-binding/permease protein MsbA [Caenispirillum salinarum AK4]|uniref:Lipid A export ATP-binding/permease protein MsbA n=1 Tax=Caenispirillum salinarum AK4 TaxID=1238182 RepID=K9GNH0_9PROT|nr:ABC transporter ATP-binding protein [Caenispirillum salinarum]EKV27520.1 Lipid A export ATP-binding/permease protein MsbA [Caenispirillum salinarum AK4]
MSRKHSTRALFGRLLREAVRPYAARIGLAVVAMAVAAAAQGMTAWLMEPVVDQVFSQKDKSMLWPVAIAVLATFAVKGIAEYSQSGLMSHVGLRAIADLQNRLYAHLTSQDVAFFQAHKTGSLVSRFLVDVNLLRAAVSNGITGVGKDALTAAALIGVMFYQDWVLATAAFLVFPIAIYPVARLGRRMRKVSVNTQEQMGAFNTLLEQSFAGIRMVKAYRMERVEQGRVAELTETVYRLTQKGALTRAASSPIMEMMGGIAVTVVIVYGGLRVIEGVTTTGAFFSFITALMMAYRPLKALANLNTVIQEGMGAAQRLFDVLDTRPAITDAPDAQPLLLSGGHVRLEGVTFRYDAAETDERPALHGLDLDVPAGRTVALVGPSGSGKSTVMNMIPRFYDATEGRVTVDGQDVRAVTLDSLRDAVALVSQEVVLFDDTVAANIGFGKPGATREEIETAARNAAAHEFIAALPQGYDTIVGERGLKLSGGQRQRLSIARAMLKNAPILLLDEATSALDTESERQVQGALEDLMRGRTTLVIAHRLSTVTNADLIHVIDAGRLVESGTHEDLLRKGGAYARLYQLQFAAEQAPGQGGEDIALAP